IHLGVGSGTHAQQTGNVMIAYEKVLFDTKPDLVIVVGDVNSTVAATLAAVKLGIKTAHLEAGLRSGDRTMPEEINRIVTDSIADHLWTPSPDGNENLRKEGVPEEKITLVGNIMIDSLEMARPAIEAESIFLDYGCQKKNYGLVTLHRPSNVDNPETLKQLCTELSRISDRLPLIFPIHPRTRANLEKFSLTHLLADNDNIRLIAPLGYIHFMNLVFNARLLITDSGGVQEETTYLGIPCLTLRPNTERPVTVTLGTNKLCTPATIFDMVTNTLDGKIPEGRIPDLWDGRTARRVADLI
ncbi:MAG: UDP-N-acetylglucosamine 2-epimerase (non-hydrolyzing), partial [Desulfobacteraceae bacterium]|nr:UDP-N-acetylglucosamine 2-epimerase (non-hydrolyzing) [Desulfobacteraceae bacterium]